MVEEKNGIDDKNLVERIIAMRTVKATTGIVGMPAVQSGIRLRVKPKICTIRYAAGDVSRSDRISPLPTSI